MPHTLSPSSLKLLKECSRCFWLHFNKNIRRPTAIFPSLPSGMDRILKEHFDRFMNKGLLPPELKSLNGDVKLFDNKVLLTRWRDNFPGIQWIDDHHNKINCAIDNILQKGTKLIVLDYKTRGYPLKEDTASYNQDQLDIYNFLLRKNGYETEDYAYLLFYHPNCVHENGSVDFHTELVKMKTDVKNAENIINKALTTLKADIPQSDKKCGFCEYEQKKSPFILSY